MRMQATWIVIVGTLVACAGFVAAVIGFFGERNMAIGVVGTIIAAVAIVGTVVLYRQSGATGRAAFEQALRADFAPSVHNWFHASGLALDTSRKLVLVGTDRGTHRVALADVSGVTYQPTRTGPAFGSNSVMALILLPVAIAAMVHNARAAGLFVATRGGTYRIVGVQPRDAEDWQTRLAAARSS
jgi:hypothetical protein